MAFCNTFLSTLLISHFIFFSVAITTTSYQLDTEFSGATFFDNFDSQTTADLTHGFVTYVDQDTASNNGLISAGNDSPVYMGVDDITVLNPDGAAGRESVRITSKKAWNHGLFILDLAHMPGSICGAWPAYWLLGPDWPNNGEIDIIEGVNRNTVNLMSLHSNAECSISGLGETGTLQTTNCDVGLNYENPVGCGVVSNAANPNTYGTFFNNINGGVYATEWTSACIKIWFFPRTAIPADITAGTPNSALWGTPMANLAGNCIIDSHFKNQQIVFDTTFCGNWAGIVWSSDVVCSTKANTCVDYVALNPGAFTEAYWAINSLKVYENLPVPVSSTVRSSVKNSISSKVSVVSGVKSSFSSTKANRASSSSSSKPAVTSSFKSALASTTISLALSSLSSKTSVVSSNVQLLSSSAAIGLFASPVSSSTSRISSLAVSASVLSLATTTPHLSLQVSSSCDSSISLTPFWTTASLLISSISPPTPRRSSKTSLANSVPQASGSIMFSISTSAAIVPSPSATSTFITDSSSSSTRPSSSSVSSSSKSSAAHLSQMPSSGSQSQSSKSSTIATTSKLSNSVLSKTSTKGSVSARKISTSKAVTPSSSARPLISLSSIKPPISASTKSSLAVKSANAVSTSKKTSTSANSVQYSSLKPKLLILPSSSGKQIQSVASKSPSSIPAGSSAKTSSIPTSLKASTTSIVKGTSSGKVQSSTSLKSSKTSTSPYFETGLNHDILASRQGSTSKTASTFRSSTLTAKSPSLPISSAMKSTSVPAATSKSPVMPQSVSVNAQSSQKITISKSSTMPNTATGIADDVLQSRQESSSEATESLKAPLPSTESPTKSISTPALVNPSSSTVKQPSSSITIPQPKSSSTSLRQFSVASSGKGAVTPIATNLRRTAAASMTNHHQQHNAVHRSSSVSVQEIASRKPQASSDVHDPTTLTSPDVVLESTTPVYRVQGTATVEADALSIFTSGDVALETERASVVVQGTATIVVTVQAIVPTDVASSMNGAGQTQSAPEPTGSDVASGVVLPTISATISVVLDGSGGAGGGATASAEVSVVPSPSMVQVTSGALRKSWNLEVAGIAVIFGVLRIMV